MIFLTGSVNQLTPQQMQQKAERYQANGWEQREANTHSVRVTIAMDDIEAFCSYLRALTPDNRPKVWTDRNGERHEAPACSFWLRGVEVAGNWIRLSAALSDRTSDRSLPAPAASTASATATASRRPAPAPVRRTTAPTASAPAGDPPAAPGWQSPDPVATQAPAANSWNTAPADFDDDDIPF